MELPWNTQEHKDKMRKLRERALSSLYKLAVIQMGLAFVSVVCGVLTIYFSFPNPNFPYVFGGPIISGLPVLIAAVIMFYHTRNPESKEEASFKIKCTVILHYVICVTCISFSFISSAFSGWGLGYCVSDGKTRQGQPVIEFCLPNKTENIIMASIDIAVGFILGVSCILATVFFCFYGRAFGFKSREQRAVELTFQMMASQGQMAAYQGQMIPGQGQMMPYQGQTIPVQGRMVPVQDQIGFQEKNKFRY